jgi:hypothetical protein
MYVSFLDINYPRNVGDRKADYCTVTRILPSHLPGHLAGVFIPTSRVHGFSSTEQHHSFEVWAEGRCGYSADVPFARVYRYRGPSSVSGLGCYLYAGGVWKWAC